MSHIISNHIDKWVSQILISDNEKDREEHVSSGKLSASMLGAPLQAQILKVKGVPPKEVDEYVLRKFKRGKDVEDWLVKTLPALIATQKPVEYRNVVGLIDAVVSTSGWEKDFGAIPLEVKSVTNAKYKNIIRSGEADRSHILQACLYALAESKDYFAICYIASDDYRITTMIFKTADYKAEVDSIIDKFEAQLASEMIPMFEAIEKWQSSPQYYSYPDFMDLNLEEVNAKFKKEYESKKK